MSLEGGHIPALNSAPKAPEVNDLYYDIPSETTKRWNGTSWVVQGSGTYVQQFAPEAYGADPTGATVTTAAVQAAINAAVAAPANLRKVVYLAGDYLVGTLACTGNRIKFTGPGRLLQAVAGSAVLDMSSSSLCVIDDDLDFEGISGATRAGGNSAIIGTGATGLRIGAVVINNFQTDPIFLTAGIGVTIGAVRGTGNNGGVRLYGCVRVSHSGTTMTSPNTPSSVFLTCFYLNSTNDYAALCSDISYSQCKTAHYVNAQSFIAHGGTKLRYALCGADDALCGFSFGPFQAGDTLSDVTVAACTYNGTSTAGALTSTANYGFGVQGSSTFTADHLTFSACVANGANQIALNATSGGFVFGYANNVTVSGCDSHGCVCNGMSVNNPCTALNVTGGQIDGVVANAGNQVGFYLSAGSANTTGGITGVTIDGTGGLVACLRADGTSLNFHVGPNNYTGTYTNAITNPQRVGTGYSPALTTNPPVSGTVYRNNDTVPKLIQLPAYATAAATAGAVAVAFGPSSAPTTQYVRYVSGSTSVNAPEVITFMVPVGWDWSVTLFGVTLVTTRTDASCGTTSASATVTDAAILATDLGRPVAGTGIPANTYVGTVTAGVSFLLSSSPISQVNVNATATGTVPLVIGLAAPTPVGVA